MDGLAKPNNFKTNMRNVFYALILLELFPSLISTTSLPKNDGEATAAWHDTNLSQYFLLLAANHPLYKQIAMGTLNQTNFFGFIQQDDVYVTSLFDSVRILHDRVPESDIYTRRELKHVLNSRDYYLDYFKKMYLTSHDEVTTPKHSDPVTVGYIAFERRAAMYDDIGVALTTLFPCYTVWQQMGTIIQQIADLKNNPDHTYRDFIRSYSNDNSELKKFEALLTHHYNYNNSSTSTVKETTAVRKKMFQTYLIGLDWEWKFAENGLNTVAEKKGSRVLTFTDLVESKVAVNLQQQMIKHDFWKQLAEGTLAFKQFEALIKQDLIYLYGLYAAIERIENAEHNLEMKEQLRKNGTDDIRLFEKQVGAYGFELDDEAEPFTQEYINFLLSSASRSIHEGLAALYPCYYLWNEVAKHAFMVEAVQNLNHPFKHFITSTLNYPAFGSNMTKLKKLVNGYYESLAKDDWIEKDRMFRAAENGIYHEFLFIDGIMSGPSHVD